MAAERATRQLYLPPIGQSYSDRIQSSVLKVASSFFLQKSSGRVREKVFKIVVPRLQQGAGASNGRRGRWECLVWV